MAGKNNREKILTKSRAIDLINAGISRIDVSDPRFANLTINRFDQFRFGNYCPSCGWEREPQELRLVTPTCPRCGASWNHTSVAAGTGGPDAVQ